MFSEHRDGLHSLGIWTYCDELEMYLVCGIEAPSSMSDCFVERFGRLVCVGAYDEFTTRLIDPFHIVRVAEGFSYHNRPCELYGIENLNQISGVKRNFGEVLDICKSYLLSPPVNILGWPVPLFQQPAWDLSKVRRAIKCAKTVSEPKMMEQVINSREAASRLLKAGNKFSDEKFRRYFFYTICMNGRDPRAPEQDDQFPKLFLRYDASDAYIVEGRRAPKKRCPVPKMSKPHSAPE